jgi:hypothetical protein
MELQDLVLVSVDDHLIEPEDMFVRQRWCAGRVALIIGWWKDSELLVSG